MGSSSRSPVPVLQVGVVSAFAQTLRRYTSLNHLAQAARAVLQNTSQINQMLSDLNRVDFANVQVTCGAFPYVTLSRTGTLRRFPSGSHHLLSNTKKQLNEQFRGLMLLFQVSLPSHCEEGSRR